MAQLTIDFNPIILNPSGYRVRYREAGIGGYTLYPTVFFSSPAILTGLPDGEYEGYLYPVCDPDKEEYFNTLGCFLYNLRNLNEGPEAPHIWVDFLNCSGTPGSVLVSPGDNINICAVDGSLVPDQEGLTILKGFTCSEDITTTSEPETTTEEDITTTTQDLIQVNLWAMGLYQTFPGQFLEFGPPPNLIYIGKTSGSAVFTPIDYRTSYLESMQYSRRSGSTIYTTPYPCTGTLSRGGSASFVVNANPSLGGVYLDYRVRKVLKIDGNIVQDFNDPIIGSNSLFFSITPSQSNTINTIDVEIWGLRADNTWD